MDLTSGGGFQRHMRAVVSECAAAAWSTSPMRLPEVVAPAGEDHVERGRRPDKFAAQNAVPRRMIPTDPRQREAVSGPSARVTAGDARGPRRPSKPLTIAVSKRSSRSAETRPSRFTNRAPAEAKACELLDVGAGDEVVLAGAIQALGSHPDSGSARPAFERSMRKSWSIRPLSKGARRGRRCRFPASADAGVQPSNTESHGIAPPARRDADARDARFACFSAALGDAERFAYRTPRDGRARWRRRPLHFLHQVPRARRGRAFTAILLSLQRRGSQAPARQGLVSPVSRSSGEGVALRWRRGVHRPRPICAARARQRVDDAAIGLEDTRQRAPPRPRARRSRRHVVICELLRG